MSVRLPLASLTPGPRKLDGAASRYLSRVLRVAVGATIEVFDPRVGAQARARVVAIEAGMLAIEIEATMAIAPAETPLILIQGHPKGDKLAAIVRDATEIGATAIFTAICDRSIARPDGDRAASRAERLSTVAEQAARQCGRRLAPEIYPPMPWRDALTIARSQVDAAFVFWERATVGIGADLRALTGARAIAVAIGPEGGLTDDEITIANDADFLVRSMGPSILRTETAAAAALAAVRLAGS